MSDCLFCKIIAGEIPTTKVYEDDKCLAFLDIAPLAPKHFLVIPKQHFASAAEVTEENEALIGHIYTVIAKLAKEQGFADGYRVVTNVGELAGQTVHHIHFHVLSGKQLGSFNRFSGKSFIRIQRAAHHFDASPAFLLDFQWNITPKSGKLCL